ncbi:MAG: SRPBCC family protein [Gammaproteobacteria bacterium]|nr:SRPBCC family protein [Gammaproteobacteria bacterium]MBT5793152.1 SRPBCC family protein [Gammaproteobacteria bacterium]MBT6666006.1 SRPBCC family protein [Gammaproteobacteria bacterium]MBT6948935.1 SRPBCC family protein [Gammaproteobacteria bacterium]MBT7722188.1 SRPBCC family protein [Gammaproteobacteria bacterium]
MIEIEHKRHTDLSAETVWEEVRHYDRVLNWIPRGDESRITVKGKGIGMIRDIELATQGYVQHRLIAFDNDKRMFSYTLTAGKPIGMQDYTVVATVSPIDDNHCTIRWAGKMTADNKLNESEIGQALEVALGNMTTGIIALLKGETPRFIEQPNEDWQLQPTPSATPAFFCDICYKGCSP